MLGFILSFIYAVGTVLFWLLAIGVAVSLIFRMMFFLTIESWGWEDRRNPRPPPRTDKRTLSRRREAGK